MTYPLEQAISAVQNLPEADQNMIAGLIMAELADQKHWERQFAQSQTQLGKLAEKVRSDIQAGRVRSGGIDEL